MFRSEQATCTTPYRTPLLVALSITLGAGGASAWSFQKAVGDIHQSSTTLAMAALALLGAFIVGMLATGIIWIVKPVSRRTGEVSLDELALRFRGKVAELRVLGESCASPRLRVAFQEIADAAEPLADAERIPEWASAFEKRS